MQLSPRFCEAFEFAFQLHADHHRKKSTVPYISHLMSVAALVLEFGGTENQAIAALLHDAIEDQAERYGGTEKLAQAIEERFGREVLEIVRGCSEIEVRPKPPWRDRKEAYISHIQTAPASIRLVSMCDKLHNARCIVTDYHRIGEAVWERFNAGKKDTIWYYRSLVRVFENTDTNHPLLRELDTIVCEMEAVLLETV